LTQYEIRIQDQDRGLLLDNVGAEGAVLLKSLDFQDQGQDQDQDPVQGQDEGEDQGYAFDGMSASRLVDVLGIASDFGPVPFPAITPEILKLRVSQTSEFKDNSITIKEMDNGQMPRVKDLSVMPLTPLSKTSKRHSQDEGHLHSRKGSPKISPWPGSRPGSRPGSAHSSPRIGASLAPVLGDPNHMQETTYSGGRSGGERVKSVALRIAAGTSYRAACKSPL